MPKSNRKPQSSNPVLAQIVQRLNVIGIEASFRDPNFADFDFGFIGYCDEAILTFIHFFTDVPPSLIARVSRSLASIDGWTVREEAMYLDEFADGAELLFGCEAIAAYAQEMLAGLEMQNCAHASKINN